MFVVALLTGMRRGEVLGLPWEHVYFDGRLVRVTGSPQRVGGRLQRLAPKTDGSDREVEVPDMVISALRAHRMRQLAERLRAGFDWIQTEYVFTSERGTPMEPRNVYRTCVTLVERAGLPKERIHDQRRCFATLQRADEVPIHTVIKRLGHTQISTTLDIYGHVTKVMRREAAERMGFMFG